MPIKGNVIRCTTRLAIAMACLLPFGWVQAAVPLPPCLEGSACPQTGADPFDLSGYDIPAETMCPWPTAPQTTSTVTVTSPSELQAAADRGDVEIVVAWNGVMRGDVTLDRSDVAVVMPNNATLDGRIQIGTRSGADVQRISWTGGNQVGGPFILDEADDVLVQDFHSTKDAGGSSTGINDMRCSPGGCNRVAFVSTTFAGINPGPLDSYVFYTAPNPEPSQCMILADFLAEQAPGGSHVSRIQGNRQIIIVDSAWIQPENGGTAFRFHRAVTNPFVADAHIRGRIKFDDIEPSAGVSVLEGVFDNVTVYNSVNRAFATQSPLPNTGVVRNSLIYTTLGDDDRDMSSFLGPLQDGGGNDIRNWDGQSFPLPDSRGVVPDIGRIGAER